MSYAHLHTITESAFVPCLPLVGGDLAREYRNSNALL
jgi:hypothetical protein